MSQDHDDKTEIYLPDRSPRAEPSGIPGDHGAPPKARLICTDVNELEEGHPSLEIALSSREVTVGRGQGNTVTVPSTQLSRVHARIYPGPGKWGIEDLDSRNGVWVNDAVIKQCWLKPGDVVKLGPIPFRYDLDRPEVQDATAMGFNDTMITDKTMLVGSDVRAASSLLRAVQKRDENPGAEAAAPSAVTDAPRRADSNTAGGREKPATKKRSAPPTAAPAKGGSKLMRILVGVVVLAVIGYFGFSYIGGAGERDAVKQYSANIKSFIADYEHAAGEHTDRRATEELGTLTGMLDSAKAAADTFPKSAPLRGAAVELGFLRFEREFDIVLRARSIDKARALIAENTTELARQRSGVAAVQDVKETFDSISGLYRLAAAALELRAFQLKYPNPDDAAAPRPAADALADVGKDIEDFAQEKRTNNLALSVRYRYLLKVIKDVEENDLRILNRWREAH